MPTPQPRPLSAQEIERAASERAAQKVAMLTEDERKAKLRETLNAEFFGPIRAELIAAGEPEGPRLDEKTLYEYYRRVHTREMQRDNKAQLHGEFYFRPTLSPDEVRQTYFIDKGKTFSPLILAREIATRHVFRRHPESGELYIYDPDKRVFEIADEFVGRHAAQSLGLLCNSARVSETLAEINRVTPKSERHDPRFILTQNGVFDLLNSTLGPDDPSLFFTHKFPFSWNENATCPTFDAFLQSVQPDEKMRKTLLEAMAYTLFYDRPIHKCNFLLYGSGANGKSTFLKVLRAFLGEKNVSSVSMQSIEEHRFALYSMLDKHANVHADLGDTELETTSRFKQITGGDAVDVEIKGGAYFSAQLHAKMFFSANHVPPVPDHDPAFFRRWVLVPFTENFEGREDLGLEKKLTTQSELDGIFRKVAGLLPAMLARGGFEFAPKTEDTRELYLTLSRPLYRFIKDFLVYPSENDAPVSKNEVYRAYVEYAKKNNKPLFNLQEFSKKLYRDPELAGIIRLTKLPVDANGYRAPAYFGIELKKDDTAPLINRDKNRIVEVCRELEKELDAVSRADVAARVFVHGISLQRVHEIIDDLLKSGELYEPKPDFLKIR